MKLSDAELRQKQYYNDISSNYDLHYGGRCAIEYRRVIYRQILNDIPTAGVRVLDAMCGGGQNTSAILGFDCHITGVDLSEEQCAHYKKRFPNNEVRCASLLDTAFPDASFDLIICDSLHHLHPHVNDGVLELIRLLRPGGHLLLWEPSAGSVLDRARRLWYKMDKCYFEDNEAAIDTDQLARKHRLTINLVKQRFGGNIAYLLVFTSMVFRIPAGLVPYYAPLLMPIEKFIGMFQSKLTSLWVLSLFKKTSGPG